MLQPERRTSGEYAVGKNSRGNSVSNMQTIEVYILQKGARTRGASWLGLCIMQTRLQVGRAYKVEDKFGRSQGTT